MARTTKSPIALAKAALAAGKRALPDYAHRFSPHKFTQPQLFAILALRQFLKTDYRGVVQVLREWSDLRQVLGLTEVPNYSTLCYAQRRLLKKTASRGSSTPRLKKPAASV
jgi:hypothetical protein